MCFAPALRTTFDSGVLTGRNYSREIWMGGRGKARESPDAATLHSAPTTPQYTNTPWPCWAGLGRVRLQRLAGTYILSGPVNLHGPDAMLGGFRRVGRFCGQTGQTGETGETGQVLYST